MCRYQIQIHLYYGARNGVILPLNCMILSIPPNVYGIYSCNDTL
jgi:hypothetical protein